MIISQFMQDFVMIKRIFRSLGEYDVVSNLAFTWVGKKYSEVEMLMLSYILKMSGLFKSYSFLNGLM